MTLLITQLYVQVDVPITCSSIVVDYPYY